MWLQSLKRASLHAARGTLPGVIRRTINEYRYDARRAWWLDQRARGAGAIVHAIAPGIRMQLHFDDDMAWQIYAGNCQWRELQFLRRFLRPGDVFVDAGAHIGYFTLTAAAAVGSAGRVYAFEPCARTYQRLTQNVALNGLRNVACERRALSNAAGHSTLNVVVDGHSEWNSFPPPVGGTGYVAEDVECIRWDDFAERAGAHPAVTLMKIDTQGWERQVLEGARALLASPDAPDLLVQVADETCTAAGTSCAVLLDTVRECGYAWFEFDSLRNRCVPHAPRTDYPYVYLIASRRIDRVDARLDSRRLPRAAR